MPAPAAPTSLEPNRRMRPLPLPHPPPRRLHSTNARVHQATTHFTPVQNRYGAAKVHKSGAGRWTVVKAGKSGGQGGLFHGGLVATVTDRRGRRRTARRRAPGKRRPSGTRRGGRARLSSPAVVPKVWWSRASLPNLHGRASSTQSTMHPLNPCALCSCEGLITARKGEGQNKSEKFRELVGKEAASKSGQFTFLNCFDMGSGSLACTAKEGAKLFVYNLRTAHMEMVRQRAIEKALADAVTEGLTPTEVAKQAQKEGAKATKSVRSSSQEDIGANNFFWLGLL